MTGVYIPSRHAPQRLDTSVRVALALQQPLPRVGNLFSLPVQVAKGASADLLRLERDALTLPQSVT